MSDEEVFEPEDSSAEEVSEAGEAAAEQVGDEPERRNGHGPGLLLGVILGTAAGAAAAALLARGNPGEPSEGGILHTIRARVHDAAEEGREAAREREAELMSRYDELTR
ncbi:MAG: hypothetical protein WEB04_01645 [Dehalococcoidia bacterium]